MSRAPDRLRERVLIVGASGYVGSRLHRSLRADAVLGTYRRRGRADLRRLDVADRAAIESLVSEFEPTVVLFVGGFCDVDACEASPEVAFGVNARAVAALGELTRARIVYFSADYVFDGRAAPYAEDAARSPLNVYGASKCAGEDITRALSPANVVLRASKVYGFSGERDDTFCRLCARQDDLEIEDDRVSRPVLIDDIVTATHLVLARPHGGVYHLAGPTSHTRLDFHRAVATALGHRYVVRRATVSAPRRRAPRPLDTSLSTDALRALGWNPTDVDEALRRLARPPAPI